ncbi:MAG: sigma-54-dependent Fis family transcriptional regulator [Calditrichales bacterium]|nr:MAG: sigma-54-dependent Fis family transcriptional regulator [Calditrichales bacterium]
MEKNILIVDDETNLTFFLKEGLQKKGYNIEVANSLAEGKEKVRTFYPDLLLLDLNLPDGYGLDLFTEVQAEREGIPTIVITAHSSVQSAIEALKMGVDDYIAKPFDLNKLNVLIESLMEKYHLKNQLNYYRRRAQCSDEFDFFVSELPILKEIQQTALRIAEVPVSNILIEGDTGTGKEMLARFIHANSAQADAPFVEINCASLPETLLESELFGFEAGAFTDAKKRKIGLIELAQGGTLFLDEIGEMSIPLQAKLLRFLENHSFKRLGGISDIRVELRIIAATNRNLEQLVKEDKFRQDLFFRLNVFRLHLPSLAERKAELLLIAQFFVEKLNLKLKRKITSFSVECKDVIMHYNWPGNFRELHNVIERAMILCNSDTIIPDNLPKEIHDSSPSSSLHQPALSDLSGDSLKDYLNNIEYKLLSQAMEVSGGNQLKAAKMLNEPRHIVRYLLKKHQLSSE